MPLYNNILGARGRSADQAKSSPSASMRLLQDHLASKRKAQQQANVATKKLASQLERSHNKDQVISEQTLHGPSENDWDPADEYDPMAPNSYELILADYIKAEEQRAALRLSTSTTKIAPGGARNMLHLLDVVDKLDEVDGSVSPAKVRGTAIAPPPSLVCKRDPNSSVLVGSPTDRSQPDSALTGSRSVEGGSVAAKIMSKMGYKAGAGLGRDQQGMSSPLEVEKSGVNSGRIVQGQQAPALPAVKVKSEPSRVADLLRESTRVLLLQNMVGPGEVDDDLEAETKEECTKYGQVIKCLIYEIPNKRVPDDQAVRIFIEFRQVESAIKAASDLNGRYFGGRIVRASFYDVDKFLRYELAL